jgi:hypothetical protein
MTTDRALEEVDAELLGSDVDRLARLRTAGGAPMNRGHLCAPGHDPELFTRVLEADVVTPDLEDFGTS